jgi:2-dehydro-3-deoxygluconokinase
VTELLSDFDSAPDDVDVSTVGEGLGVMTPLETGRLRDVAAFEKDVGGAELNVAVALSRLGHRSRWSGRVGDDEIGHQVVATLRGAGVDTAQVHIDPSGRTGLYLKEQRPTGRLRVHYYRDGSAATTLAPRDLDLTLLTAARIVHLTGITACLQPYGATVVEAVLDAARQRNRLVSFDANVRHKLLGDRDARDLLRPALQGAHVLIFSEEEAVDLLGGADEAALSRALAELRAARVVVVHGAWGAIAVDDKGTWRSDSYPAVPVDVVGAGDAFVAGFLSGLLRGWSTTRALRLANACGACAVGVRGDTRSMPYEDDAVLLVEGAPDSER